MSDLIAILLNEALDLGIAEQGISFGALLRSRHVLAVGLPSVVRKHSKTLEYDKFAKSRNNIVHRGQLNDLELASIRRDWLTGIVHRTNGGPLSDDEASRRTTEEARIEKRVEERARELIAKRQAEYRAHLAATHVMLGDFATVLVPLIQTHVAS